MTEKKKISVWDDVDSFFEGEALRRKISKIEKDTYAPENEKKVEEKKENKESSSLKIKGDVLFVSGFKDVENIDSFENRIRDVFLSYEYYFNIHFLYPFLNSKKEISNIFNRLPEHFFVFLSKTVPVEFAGNFLFEAKVSNKTIFAYTNNKKLEMNGGVKYFKYPPKYFLLIKKQKILNLNKKIES